MAATTPATSEQFRAFVQEAHQRLEAALTDVVVAARMIPTLRQVLRELQQHAPETATDVEAVLAMCDIVEVAGIRTALLAKLIEEKAGQR